MTTPESGDITLEKFRVIAQRAGLDFTQEEMEHLLPLYQQFIEQVGMLHDPDLSLGLPAVTFVADETG
jgi:hypothetical protein